MAKRIVRSGGESRDRVLVKLGAVVTFELILHKKDNWGEAVASFLKEEAGLATKQVWVRDKQYKLLYGPEQYVDGISKWKPRRKGSK